eukprot:1137594-Prymnesium_polylepis.1
MSRILLQSSRMGPYQPSRAPTWLRSEVLSQFFSDLRSVGPEVVGRAVRRDRLRSALRAVSVDGAHCEARFRKA